MNLIWRFRAFSSYFDVLLQNQFAIEYFNCSDNLYLFRKNQKKFKKTNPNMLIDKY